MTKPRLRCDRFGYISTRIARMKLRFLLTSLVSCLCIPSIASAQTWYAGGSLGVLMQSDSDNFGVTGAFSTGNGEPAVPNGTAIAAGTPYGWTTEFENGIAANAEVGLHYDSGLRSGIELTYTAADVDRHFGVDLAGTRLDGVDAAVLTGSPTQLGANVGAVVADGRGDLNTIGLFVNGYYDFNRDGAIQPYLGAGVGFISTEVAFNPSGVGIIDGDDTAFAWQLKAGATLKVADAWEVYGEYVYRQADDVALDNQLFPGSLDIENQQSAIVAGVRFRFG